MAYPSLNPLKLTIAQFEKLYNSIAGTKRWMNDHWTDEDVLHWKTKLDNARLTWQHHLPAYYVDPFSDEYHEQMFAEVPDDEKAVIEVV